MPGSDGGGENRARKPALCGLYGFSEPHPARVQPEVSRRPISQHEVDVDTFGAVDRVEIEFVKKITKSSSARKYPNSTLVGDPAEGEMVFGVNRRNSGHRLAKAPHRSGGTHQGSGCQDDGFKPLLRGVALRLREDAS
jgi:hypothetical protein